MFTTLKTMKKPLNIKSNFYRYVVHEEKMKIFIEKNVVYTVNYFLNHYGLVISILMGH